MSARYDVLVIDLDGTLLTSKGKVSPQDAAAVARAREAGIEILIATGRALVESLDPLQAIAHAGIAVTAGGSIRCHAGTGRTLHRSVMPHEIVVHATHALLENGHKALLLKDAEATGYDYLAVGPAELDPASAWWFETLPVRVRFVEELADDPHPDETVRLGAVATEPELAPLALALQEELGERAFLQHWSAVTERDAIGSSTHLLEVFNPKVDKWMQVVAHCEERGIDSERVAAIGDGLNDVQLVRSAGLGIAMENADPRVRKVADQATASNDCGGVAQAIARILDGSW